jgi:hypothetical protein
VRQARMWCRRQALNLSLTLSSDKERALEVGEAPGS